MGTVLWVNWWFLVKNMCKHMCAKHAHTNTFWGSNSSFGNKSKNTRHQHAHITVSAYAHAQSCPSWLALSIIQDIDDNRNTKQTLMILWNGYWAEYPHWLFPSDYKRLWITDGWALTIDRALDHRQTAVKLIQAPVNSCPLPPEVAKTIFKSGVQLGDGEIKR